MKTMKMVTVAVITDNALDEGEILLPLSHIDYPKNVDVIRLPFHAPIIDTLFDKILNVVRRIFGAPPKHRYDVIDPVLHNMEVVGRTDGEFVSVSVADARTMALDFDGDTITYAYEE
jgi:hypothetical protein